MICGMKQLGFNLAVAGLCFVVGLVGVSLLSFSPPRSQVSHSAVSSPVVITYEPQCTQRQAVSPRSPIRQFDFLNFTYPNRSSGYRGLRSQLKFTDGEFELYNPEEHFIWLISASPESIIYTDLTNDGEEEAVIEMFSHSGASGGEHFIYIYTMAGNRPRLLWFFETYASGTDIGGLKEIYSHHGDLILELYGRNKVIGTRSTLDEKYVCDPCYKEFTQVRFQWNGKSFEKKGRVEIIPLADKHY